MKCGLLVKLWLLVSKNKFPPLEGEKGEMS